MEQILNAVIYNVLGFVIGGLIMMGLLWFTSKWMVRKFVQEALSDETKERLTKWFEEGVKNGIGGSLVNLLQDEDVKWILKNILLIGEKKLGGEDKKK